MKKLDVSALERTIVNRAQNDIELCNIAGSSVLVAQDGKIIYKNHFGVDQRNGEKLSDNTLFRLASMTKPISAVAAMILVERGLISLDDTIDKYYPKFSSLRVYDNGKETDIDSKITVKQLLTHSSGIASGEIWGIMSEKMKDSDKESVDAFVDFISEQPLSFVPGTKQEYSALGAFSVLAGIIQKVTGKSYENFLKDEIFTPCQMKNTTFLPSEDQWERIVFLHDKADGKNTVAETYSGCVFHTFPAQNYLGGAGLISSMEDYFNFALMLQNGGVFDGKRVISSRSVETMSRPQFFKRAEESWGLGVRVVTNENNNTLPIGTYGWSGAFGTHFFIDPSNKIIGIYMKNSEYDGGSGAITSKNFEVDVYSCLV